MSVWRAREAKAGISIEELAEDIARRSLLQSLNVRPVLNAEGEETGTFEVPAGGRRYRALELLVKQKRMNKSQLVPCIVRTDGLPEEDSLGENVQRAALHPLDQFCAFQTLREKGVSEEEIAAHHGQSRPSARAAQPVSRRHTELSASGRADVPLRGGWSAMDPKMIARAAAVILLAGTVLAYAVEMARQDRTPESLAPSADDGMDSLAGELTRCKALGAEAAHDAACKAAWAQHRARFLAPAAPHQDRSIQLFPATPTAPKAADRVPSTSQPAASTPGMVSEGR
jgi:conjugative transfer region protein TrbK